MSVSVSITQFRREIFDLVRRSVEGEQISIVYKGSTIRLVSDVPVGDRLGRITPLQVVNPASANSDEQVMKQSMAQAWERDWSDL